MKLPGFYKSRCSTTLSSGMRLAAHRDISVLKKPAPSDSPMDAQPPFVCATHSSAQPIFLLSWVVRELAEIMSDEELFSLLHCFDFVFRRPSC
jgi:hypothetical protein